MDDKKRLKLLLLNFGFTDHYTRVLHNDQEALIELLLKFSKQMQNGVMEEVINKGIGETLINQLIELGNNLKHADIKQEHYKDVSVKLTEESMIEFNAIYKQAINICKICRTIFASSPSIAKNFSFTHILKNLNQPRKAIDKTEATTVTN